MADRPLAGRGIVVTRPREQAQALAARIEAAGARAHVYPAIEIRDVADPRAALDALARLEQFDLAVFVSPTAVRQAFALLGQRRWPARLPAAGVGAATRAALRDAGVAVALAPEGRADSEALLELPELADVAGRRIAIFRGEGGREALAEGLAARGAHVEHVACYRRARPDTDLAPLVAAWRRGEVHAVTLSSSEGLRNFVALLGAEGRALVESLPLLVPHERVAAEARRMGAARAVVAGPTNDEMLEGLVAYFSTS